MARLPSLQDSMLHPAPKAEPLTRGSGPMRRHPARGQGGEKNPGQLLDRVTKASPLSLPGIVDGGGQGARTKRSHSPQKPHPPFGPKRVLVQARQEGQGSHECPSPQAPPLSQRPPLPQGTWASQGAQPGSSRSLSSRSCSPLSAGSTGHGCTCLHDPDGQCPVTLALNSVSGL